MVLPIHDTNPVRRTPVITYALILINLVVFLTEPVVTAPLLGNQSIAAACQQGQYFYDHAAIPKELIDNKQLPPIHIAVDTNRGRVACPVHERHHKSPILSVLFS